MMNLNSTTFREKLGNEHASEKLSPNIIVWHGFPSRTHLNKRHTNI